MTDYDNNGSLFFVSLIITRRRMMTIYSIDDEKYREQGVYYDDNDR